MLLVASKRLSIQPGLRRDLAILHLGWLEMVVGYVSRTHSGALPHPFVQHLFRESSGMRSDHQM